MGKRKHRHMHRTNGAEVLEVRSEPVISPALEPIPPPPETVERTFDADLVNRLLNHPTIFPSITIPGREGPLDCSELVADPHNVFMIAPGGSVAFVRDEPGIYEVHTNFLPEYRGRNALRCSPIPIA
jgi:hypothetical protein